MHVSSSSYDVEACTGHRQSARVLPPRLSITCMYPPPHMTWKPYRPSPVTSSSSSIYLSLSIYLSISFLYLSLSLSLSSSIYLSLSLSLSIYLSVFLSLSLERERRVCISRKSAPPLPPMAGSHEQAHEHARSYAGNPWGI
jgi:hypothetical protein